MSCSWRARREAPRATIQAAAASSQPVRARNQTREVTLSSYTPRMAAPTRKTVLIVDADDGSRERIGTALRRECRVLRAGSAEAGLALLERERVELVLADVALPGISGFDLLRILRENYPLTEVVMMAGGPDVEAAVLSVKLGAYHFLAKDTAADTFRTIVAHASERQDLNRQVLALSAEVEERGEREFISGPSPATREVMDLVHKVAGLSATVLILGESGTGKE